MHRLRRFKDGKYVAPAGSNKSYTPYLQGARQYETKEGAEKDRCVESEYIESDIAQ